MPLCHYALSKSSVHPFTGHGPNRRAVGVGLGWGFTGYAATEHLGLRVRERKWMFRLLPFRLRICALHGSTFLDWLAALEEARAI